VFLPAQLNGKQRERALDFGRTLPGLRCPRNGTADEAAHTAFSSGALPLGTLVPGKVARAGSASPDTGQQGVFIVSAEHRNATHPRGSGWQAFPVDLSFMFRQLSALPLSLAAACAGLSSLPVQAQLTPATPLDPVLVTATGYPQPLTESLAHSTVLTREDIERSQAVDLPALLAREAGLQMARNGGRGAATIRFPSKCSDSSRLGAAVTLSWTVVAFIEGMSTGIIRDPGSRAPTPQNVLRRRGLSFSGDGIAGRSWGKN